MPWTWVAPRKLRSAAVCKGWPQGWSSFSLGCLPLGILQADTLCRLEPALAACRDLWPWSTRC